MELLACFAYQREVYSPLCTQHYGAFVYHPRHLNKQQGSPHVRAETFRLHRETEHGKKENKTSYPCPLCRAEGDMEPTLPCLGVPWAVGILTCSCRYHFQTAGGIGIAPAAWGCGGWKVWWLHHEKINLGLCVENELHLKNPQTYRKQIFVMKPWFKQTVRAMQMTLKCEAGLYFMVLPQQFIVFGGRVMTQNKWDKKLV